VVRRNSSRGEKFGACFALLFYSQNFGNTLGIFIVHFMEIERYSTVQFAAALLAHLWGLRWLLELSLGLGREKEKSAEQRRDRLG
jgi:hypothetical protein